MSVMPVPKTNVISMIKHDVYPRNEESVRNIRLWDATEKKHLAHRCVDRGALGGSRHHDRGL